MPQIPHKYIDVVTTDVYNRTTIVNKNQYPLIVIIIVYHDLLQVDSECVPAVSLGLVAANGDIIQKQPGSVCHAYTGMTNKTPIIINAITVLKFNYIFCSQKFPFSIFFLLLCI